MNLLPPIKPGSINAPATIITTRNTAKAPTAIKSFFEALELLFLNIIDIDYQQLEVFFVKTEDFISTTNVNPIEIWPAILDEIAKNVSELLLQKLESSIDYDENIVIKLNTGFVEGKSVRRR